MKSTEEESRKSMTMSRERQKQDSFINDCRPFWGFNSFGWLGSCTKDVRETNNQASSLLQPKIFLLAAAWDLSYQGNAPCGPDWEAQRGRLRRISQWRTSKSTLRFYKLCCFVFCIQIMSGILLLWFGGDDFLCYCVPKCSLVDYDAIEPRTLCLEDGSLNSPILVQIHHAKRTETWQKDKYLNSAADWFVFAQNWKVMQLNACRICLIPAPVFFCKFLHIFVFRFFLWRCSLPWTSLSNVCTGFLNLCVPVLSLKMLATVIFSLCIFLSFFYLCHLKCPI